MKALSIIIPMYNTELYIERCLDSILYDESVIRFLDIIVVDDGSSDGSLSIAKRYQKLYPDSVTVVKKENGGHGSTVNVGMRRAVGKYVRVVDSDDWVDINNFSNYVRKLKDEDADIVVTDVRRQQLYDETEVDFVFGNVSKKTIPIENVAKKIKEDNFFFEFSMHSMTVKTDGMKEIWGDGLLEKTFYVDQQFVAKVFMFAKNYTEYDMNIYMYFIGRPEQSMGAGFFRHIRDHERVLRWLLDTTDNHTLPDYYKKIVSRQIELMLRTHYSAYAGQPRLTKTDKADLMKFDAFLRLRYPTFYKNAGVAKILKKLPNVFRNNKIIKLACYYRSEKI